MINNIIAVLGILINMAGFTVAYLTTENNKILCVILLAGIVCSILSFILILYVNKKNKEEKEELEKILNETPRYKVIGETTINLPNNIE